MNILHVSDPLNGQKFVPVFKPSFSTGSLLLLQKIFKLNEDLPAQRRAKRWVRCEEGRPCVEVCTSSRKLSVLCTVEPPKTTRAPPMLELRLSWCTVSDSSYVTPPTTKTITSCTLQHTHKHTNSYSQHSVLAYSKHSLCCLTQPVPTFKRNLHL